jgi:hypothetical protein
MSPSLGDFFSANQKFKIGNIYHIRLYSKDGITTIHDNYRDKFVIIVGHDANNNAVGVIVINSEINRINYSTGLYTLHYPLDVKKYSDLLNHNSHANCSLLIPLEEIRIEKSTYKGEICQEDIDLIIETVKDAPSITPKIKKRFGLI